MFLIGKVEGLDIGMMQNIGITLGVLGENRIVFNPN